MLKDFYKIVFSKNFLIVCASILGVILFIGGLNKLLHYFLGEESIVAEIVPGILLIPVGIIIIVKVTNYLKNK